MKESSENKKLEPASNKQVRIKMRPGRAAEGVVVDKDGFATVDAKTAEHLVKIHYATRAEEK